jgi:Lhr-like helicase
MTEYIMEAAMNNILYPLLSSTEGHRRTTYLLYISPTEAYVCDISYRANF